MKYLMIALAILGAGSTQANTITCNFASYIAIDHTKSNVFHKTIKQRMTIINGKTDLATMALDGKFRATNSVKWQPISPPNLEAYNTQFIGDFGELLTLSSGAFKETRPLKGSYKASLTETSSDNTSIQIGTCVIE